MNLICLKIYLEAQKGINLLDTEQRDNIEIATACIMKLIMKLEEINCFPLTGKIKVSTLKKLKYVIIH